MSSALAAPPAAQRWTKACGLCRRTYGAAEWRELPVVTTVPAASVQGHLSVPATWDVELRQCSCGTALAARAL
ncbi:MAG TPA: hypothetical protein VEK07_00680 [Polyangiaceae bacterium]|nr:hypothetical protein [Polyangiaceae bacterium]